MQKLKNNEPQPKFTVSNKKKPCNTVTESISFPVRRKTSVTIQWGGGGGSGGGSCCLYIYSCNRMRYMHLKNCENVKKFEHCATNLLGPVF